MQSNIVLYFKNPNITTIQDVDIKIQAFKFELFTYSNILGFT